MTDANLSSWSWLKVGRHFVLLSGMIELDAKARAVELLDSTGSVGGVSDIGAIYQVPMIFAKFKEVDLSF